MTNCIKLKKGLNINLKGKANTTIATSAAATSYALIPDDFHGVTPKVMVKAGDTVKVGTPLFVDKNTPEINFVSPVSGVVLGVNRGERRKLLSITVESDSKFTSENFGTLDPSKMSREVIMSTLLTAGLVPFIKQRPYDVIINPAVAPRDIFVTAFDSAPLAPDYDFVVAAEGASIQKGIDVLAKLTNGKVYVGIGEKSKITANNAVVTRFCGPHPAGNVGIQIGNTAPINKGETVWTMNLLDLLFIGRLFTTGTLDFSRTVAIVGSEIKAPRYIKTTLGVHLPALLAAKVEKVDYNQRIISGNPLTGTKVSTEDYLRAPHSQITVIPEGDNCHEMFGWALPGCGKLSMSRTFFSWLMPKSKEYVLDARIRGGERAIIMSGEYERVMPMDILVEQLIKATLAMEIDKMENLGIYEIAPEDVALCEFVDTSKLELQHIVRQGLDALMKEMN